MTLAEIAKALNCDLEGDGDLPISGVAPIEEARPGELTFLANRKYLKRLGSTRASAIIVSRDFPALAISTLRSGNPYLSFAQSIDLFYSPPLPPPGIHATAVIADTAVIGSNPSIGPFVIVDRDVVIGDNAVLHPHVVIYSGVAIGHDFTAHSHACVRENCSIGNGVTLQNGVVIGADAPLLPLPLVEAAFSGLADRDALLAPAEDGGYVLIGLALERAPPAAVESLFAGIPWGTGAVRKATAEAARRAGLGFGELAGHWDVDRPEDLPRLAASIRTLDTAARPRRTAAVLAGAGF